jgi:hypothetical protein
MYGTRSRPAATSCWSDDLGCRSSGFGVGGWGRRTLGWIAVEEGTGEQSKRAVDASVDRDVQKVISRDGVSSSRSGQTLT